MADIQETIKKNSSILTTNAFQDLVVITVIFILVLILSYFFDAFIFIVKFISKYPKAILYVDEVISGFLTLTIGFAVFSWRRWVELRKETAERIRLQEELIKAADTKAQIERIINKQLQTEIELRREAEKHTSSFSKKKSHDEIE